MRFAIYIQEMNFDAQRFAKLSCGARNVDDHVVRVDVIHRDAVRFEPMGDGLDVGIGDAVLISELRRGQPLVVIRRGLVGQAFDVFIERLLGLERALELQEHVLELEARPNAAAVVARDGFGARVAAKRDALGFIDARR